MKITKITNKDIEKESECSGSVSPSSVYSDNSAIQGHPDPSIAPTRRRKKVKKRKSLFDF